jgi:hypothetical protein
VHLASSDWCQALVQEHEAELANRQAMIESLEAERDSFAMVRRWMW